MHALGFTFYNMVHLTNWIINGMPERFPKLKMIWIESGLAWIPFLMQRLDNEYMMRTSEAPLLKRKPSEYMREMYFTTQPMEMVDNREALELTFKMINAETQLLYSSDYPHWDMDLPSTIYDLPFLSEDGQAQHPRRQRQAPVQARFGLFAGEARAPRATAAHRTGSAGAGSVGPLPSRLRKLNGRCRNSQNPPRRGANSAVASGFYAPVFQTCVWKNGRQRQCVT